MVERKKERLEPRKFLFLRETINLGQELAVSKLDSNVPVTIA